MSMYLFSGFSRFGTTSKVALLSTTAFVFSLLSVSASFADGSGVGECVGCAKGQISAASGQIQTSGLAADEFDVRLEEKSTSVQAGTGYDAPQGQSLLSVLADGANSEGNTGRQVYIPATSPASTNNVVVQERKAAPFKEASLNISSEEERYLTDNATYVSQPRPVPTTKAAPVFGEYINGVKVAPVSAYQAAMNKNSTASAVVTTEVSNVATAGSGNNEAVIAPAPQVVESAPVYSTANAEVPPFVSEPAVVQNNAGSRLSPLEALLLSDNEENAVFAKERVVATREIPAFSPEAENNMYANAEIESEEDNLLVPMDGGAYNYSDAAFDNESEFGGAVSNSPYGRGDGYGSGYASFVSGYDMPIEKTDVAVEDDGEVSESVDATVTVKDEKPANKGIINRLKNWFAISDDASTDGKPKAKAEAPAQKTQPAEETMSISERVDNILARYMNKNQQRIEAKNAAMVDPSMLAIVFGEKSSNVSAKTVRRLTEFAENAATSEDSFVKIQLSRANLPLQAKRFALIKSILLNNGIPLERMRPSVDGDSPDTIVLKVETPLRAIGGYERIEAMGG